MKHSPNEWTRRGKKYKAQTFAALKQLYGAENDDRDCQKETSSTERRLRTDHICRLAEETRILGKRER